MKLRLKTLEEGLKHVSSFSVSPNASCGSPKPGKTSTLLGFLTSNGGIRKRSTSQPRGSTISRSSPLRQPSIETENASAVGIHNRADRFKKKCGSGENLLRKGMWMSRSKVVDSGGKENAEVKTNTDSYIDKHKSNDAAISAETNSKVGGNEDLQSKGGTISSSEDVVSGFLYDRLQKEVINLRKYCETKECSLNAKDQEIQVK